MHNLLQQCGAGLSKNRGLAPWLGGGQEHVVDPSHKCGMWRGQLNCSTLNDLLKMYLEGPEIVNFDSILEIHQWLLV